MRRATWMLLVAAVAVTGCGDEPEPPPSLAQQTGDLTQLSAEREDAHEIAHGTVITLADEVRVGVHGTTGDAVAQLHVAVEDEVVELVEVARGEAVDVGGYEVEVESLGADATWVSVTSPDGDPLTR